MKRALLIAFLISGIAAQSQTRWSNAKDWTLYLYQGRNLFQVSPDSLRFLDKVRMDPDSMNYFMSSANRYNPKGQVSWMGGYIATCHLNGDVRKLELSNYGAFFYDEKSKAFYQITAEKADAWNAYIQNLFLKLVRRGNKL